jgi:phosphoribosyl 1,2-cyclic phosphodiesterase
MRFQMLGSSSSGNCAVIETEQTRILVDAGFSGRKIEQMLALSGLSAASLEAVFLTHEHSDHIAGLRGLARHSHLEFYATYGTATAAQKPLKTDLAWRLFEAETTFRFRDLEVTALRIPHDAYDPVGYIFRSGGDSLFNPHRSIAWLTDLGYVPEHLPALLRDVDLLILEANHDLEMLESDPHRPFSVKQRIRGRHGHLSNDAACDLLGMIDRPRWQRVVLAHLSRDCNCIHKVASLFGATERPYALDVTDPSAGPGQWVELV